MDNKTFSAFLVTSSFLLIIVLSLLLTSDFKREELTRKDIEIVNNVNNFYLVESCVNKYINYLALKDYSIIYELLDDNYIDKNDITLDNINNYVKTLNNNYSFTATDMYKHKNMNIYFVKGILRTETHDYNNEEIEFKTTIKLDENNNKFSILPDGDGGVLDE